MTIRELLESATGKLTQSSSARFEAELLLGHALEASRSFLYANPEIEVPERRRRQFLELLQRRQRGEPVAYLIGHRPFWTLDLRVTPDVLIPRPETELLVEAALARLPRSAKRRVADLGTGSGAIALALAQERPGCDIHATDVSAEALEIARLNARMHGLLERVAFHLGDWAEPLTGRFDLIVSNPPYVAAGDPHLEAGDCRHEPRIALTPGVKGLEAIERITLDAPQRLQPGGWLLLEHGHDQAEAVANRMLECGFHGICALRDLSGHERVCIGQSGE